MMVHFVHSPETIMFAIDLDPEMATEATRGYSRLDVVKHAVTSFVLAKKRMCPQHKFAIATLVQDEAVLLPFSLTSNTDTFLECLNQLQPAAAAAAEQQFITSDSNDSSSSNSSSCKAFDFGSLVTAVEPLLLQQQQPQHTLQQQQVLQVAGGTLKPAPALLSATSSSSTTTSSSNTHPQQQQQQQQSNLRVILIYGRSQLPAPQLRTQQQSGLVMDCLFVHSKPQAGVNAAQEVYGALEELVDGLGVRAGHAPFIYEATAGRTSKLLGCMALLLAHPLQRRPQSDTKPSLDLLAAPLMQLPSDLANSASGVPIMPASKLPAPAAASAWSKPLVVSNDNVVTENVTENVSDAALSAWGLPAAGGGSTGGAWGEAAAVTAAAAAGVGFGGSSSSYAAAGAWGEQAHAAAAAVAAAGSAWSDPWDEPSGHTGGYGAGNLLAQQKQAITTSSSSSAAAGARAGASSSNDGKAALVTGVPAGVVQGFPDRVPSYELDESVAIGVAAAGSSDQETAAAAVPGTLDGGAGSSAAAAAASDLQLAGSGSGLEDEGLEGLAAALMSTAVEEGAAAGDAGRR